MANNNDYLSYEGLLELKSKMDITYATKGEIPTNYVALTGNQTISGLKYFSGNGLKVAGRVAGGGDDEGIVVEPASNSYAGVCCGSPSGRRAVFYLRPNDSCWRYGNGSTSFDITHPEKSGVIALTSDIPSSTKGITYLTTAPTSANTDGGLIIVVLSSEPSTKYSGYIYLITE